MNKKILQLALPNIITTITTPLLGMVDIAIVGHIGNQTHIGAIALGTMIFNLIYWNFGFLRMGTTGFTAQAYGARNLYETTTIFVRSFMVAMGIAFLLLVLQKPIVSTILYFINGSAEVEVLAGKYFFICIWAAPATLGLYSIKGWFIGMQNAKTPMIIAIIINILNILFSCSFVYIFHMQIEGVALGTLLAQYGGLLIALTLCFVQYKRLKKYIDLKNTLKIKEMIVFFKVNSNIFLRTLCLVLVFTFIPATSAKMGDTILAVNTLLMQLFTLFSYIMDGFAYAGESLVGKYVGSKNITLLRKTITILFRWGFLFCITFMLLYTLGGKFLLQLFTDKQDIIIAAQPFFYWVLLIPLVGFSAFLWDGIYVGATASKFMRNTMFIATAVFFVAYYSLQNVLGNNALWLAFIVYLSFRGLLQWKYASKAIYQKVE